MKNDEKRLERNLLARRYNEANRVAVCGTGQALDKLLILSPDHPPFTITELFQF